VEKNQANSVLAGVFSSSAVFFWAEKEEGQGKAAGDLEEVEQR
jgi:hypothetical protein